MFPQMTDLSENLWIIVIASYLRQRCNETLLRHEKVAFVFHNYLCISSPNNLDPAEPYSAVMHTRVTVPGHNM